MATLLLIEDHPNNARLIRRYLENANHKILWAADEAEGLKMAKEQSPSLILLDVGLPDIDGYLVLKLLREDLRSAKIPVIILTAPALPEDLLQAQAAGATEFMTKPIDFTQLEKRILELAP